MKTLFLTPPQNKNKPKEDKLNFVITSILLTKGKGRPTTKLALVELKKCYF